MADIIRDKNQSLGILGRWEAKRAVGLEEETAKDAVNHILVVDDDAMNLLIAKRILAKQFEVHTVTSGHEAFDLLKNQLVDLILLDIRMPQMDGFTFLQIIKDDLTYRDIPVICLTADSEQESELKCFELGAVDFISKPFIAEIMLQRVTRILELSRLQKELQKEVEKKTMTLNKRSQQLNRLTIQVMKTLASTIDAKDKYTNGHSVRVAEYSKMIAVKMGMTHQEQEDIPFVARIIGVADSYDAMSSKRSYRGILPQAHIRGEIERCMGSQFDPEVAKVMIQIIDEDKDYKLKEW